MLKLTSADSTMGSIPIWSRIRILLLLIAKFSECFIIHDSWRLGLISARGITGIFWHEDISAQEHFGTGAPVPKCLCRNVYVALHSAKMSMCQNVNVLKHPCAEMCQCCNIPVLNCPLCRNIPMLKCSRAEKSPWWNVCAEMSLAKMSGAEISPRLPEVIRR